MANKNNGRGRRPSRRGSIGNLRPAEATSAPPIHNFNIVPKTAPVKYICGYYNAKRVTNIRDVLVRNMKACRNALGLSQARLAEKADKILDVCIAQSNQ